MPDPAPTSDASPRRVRLLTAGLVMLLVLSMLGLLVAAQVWAWRHFSTYWFIGLLTVQVPVGIIGLNAGLQVVASARGR